MTILLEILRDGVVQSSLDEIFAEVTSSSSPDSRRSYHAILSYAYDLLKQTNSYRKTLINSGVKYTEVKGMWEGVCSEGKPVIIKVDLSSASNSEVANILLGIRTFAYSVLGLPAGITDPGGISTFYFNDNRDTVERPS